MWRIGGVIQGPSAIRISGNIIDQGEEMNWAARWSCFFLGETGVGLGAYGTPRPTCTGRGLDTSLVLPCWWPCHATDTAALPFPKPRMPFLRSVALCTVGEREQEKRPCEQENDDWQRGVVRCDGSAFIGLNTDEEYGLRRELMQHR